MRHWIHEVSDREENQSKKKTAELGRLAFDRVRACIELCLEIYNRRHPHQTQPIQREADDNGNLMNIMVNTRLARVGFQFKAGSPLFTRYGLSEGQQVQDQAEIRIDNDGVMQLMFGTNNKRLETVVRETLQPALFPTVQLSEADKGLEHLA